jgi:branched-chain amino acid transport system ATP-binding protein
VQEVFKVIKEINTAGTTMLLVEQNARMALLIANRGYVLETGRIVLSGKASELMDHDDVQRAYLGRDYQHKWER